MKDLRAKAHDIWNAIHWPGSKTGPELIAAGLSAAYEQGVESGLDIAEKVTREYSAVCAQMIASDIRALKSAAKEP